MTNSEKSKATAIAMAGVESAAFNAGEGRALLVERVRVACGPRPALKLYEATGLAMTVGYMASALARKGDNRPEAELRKHCRERILFYQGATGKAPLRNGQKGRRTPQEEEAYSSARVLKARIFADAKVATPTGKSGGHNKGKPSPNKGKASTKKAAANSNDRPAITKFANRERYVGYLKLQAAALMANTTKNIVSSKNTIVPSWASDAVNAFASAVEKGAAEEGAE